MEKYINILFAELSKKYKINLITIMTYNRKYKKITRTYKLVIDKKNKKSKYPEKRVSLNFYSKRQLILEMIKWKEEQN